MKKIVFTALFFGVLFGSISHSETIKNVLIGPGIFPTEPNAFIKCVAQTSLAGTPFQFLGLVKVNLLTEDNLRIEIQMLAKDTSGKTSFFNIIANSTDLQNGWQKISAEAEGDTFYFSKSISSIAFVKKEGTPDAVVFDFSNCLN